MDDTASSSFITDVEDGAPNDAFDGSEIKSSSISVTESSLETDSNDDSKAETPVDDNPFKKTFSRNGMSGLVNSTRSENDLKRATLSIPRGLKFRKAKSGTYKVPKNLKEASVSIKDLREGNRDSQKMLDNLSLDLEVLLGNKAAVSECKASESKAAPKLKERQEEKSNVHEVDLGTKGARFGGDIGGRPLSPTVVQRDLNSDEEKLNVSGKVKAVTKSAKTDSKETKKDESVESQLLGLPGNFSMTVNETEKYFGDQSRINFFDRYHWLNEQRNKYNFSSIDDNSSTDLKLLIDKSGHAYGNGFDPSEIPFAPIRPDNKNAGIGKNTLDSRVAGRDGEIFSRGASRGGKGGLFNVSSSTLSQSGLIDETKSGEFSQRSESSNSVDLFGNSAESINSRNTTILVDTSVDIDEFHTAAKQSMINRRIEAARKAAEMNQIELNDEETLQMELEAIALQSKLLITDQISIRDAGTMMSPRSKYIDCCLRQGINPKPSLVLRKGFTKELDLSHHGIGDKMGKILAECLLELPYLHSIRLADNNLTDDSLGPMVKSLVKMPNILQVDLSNNVIGDLASNTLSAYLGQLSCPIVKLVMRNADVDDFECSRFVTSLKDNPNTKLQELDLTQNLLGSAEQLNVVMPELTTAGEAFAELIESDTCLINKLELGWNMIRGDSAVALAESISVNTSLTYLDLSYNAIGKEGAVVLGHALLNNHTLIHLDLTANNIDGTGCFSLCVGLIENRHIRRFLLDGNPIGVLGAQVVMQVPMLVGNRINISVAKCNIAIVDSSISFDFGNLLKEYVLDMSNPFERSQAFMILYLIACHHTYQIDSWDWEEVPRGNKQSVDLSVFLNPDKQEFFTEKQKAIEKSLISVIDAAADLNIAVKFFNDIDVDGSGELDREEFKLLMIKLGIELDEDRLEDVFDTYDTDQGGTIGVDEFLIFLKRQKAETEKRLYDLTLTPAFCLKSDLAENTKGSLINVSEEDGFSVDVGCFNKNENIMNKKKRYIPPESGILHISIVDSFKRKAIYRTVTSSDKEFIEVIAQGTSDSVSMTTFGLSTAKLRLDEAVALFKAMSNENRNKAQVISKILPQLAQSGDARLLVTKVLKNDRQEMMTLKQTLGVAVRPLLGMANGYYTLDMSVALDRLCLMRLLEMSNSRGVLLRSTNKNPLPGLRSIDLSQKKNGSCFRNEVFNGIPVKIDTKFATPLPRMGILSFDFSGGTLPNRDDMICADARVVKILNNLQLLSSDEKEVNDAMAKLDRYTQITSLTNNGSGHTIYEAQWDRACQIGDLVDKFYNNIADRQFQLQEARENEEIVKVVSTDPSFFPNNSDEDVFSVASGLKNHGVSVMSLNIDPCHGQGSLAKKENHLHHHSNLDHTQSCSDLDSVSASISVGGASLDFGQDSLATESWGPVDGQQMLKDLNKEDSIASLSVEDIPGIFMLKVSNMSCKSLLNDKGDAEHGTKSDPFIRFILGEQMIDTRYLMNNLNPVWDQSEDFVELTWDTSPSGSMSLDIRVMDFDFTNAHDPLGKINVDLNDIKDKLESRELIALEDKHIDEGKKTSSISLHLQLIEVFPNIDSVTTEQIVDHAEGQSTEELKHKEREEELSTEEKAALDKSAGIGGIKAGKISIKEEPTMIEEDGYKSESSDEGGQKIVHNTINLCNRHANDMFVAKYRNTLLDPSISKNAKAVRVIDMLDDFFSKLWLYSRHLALILESFEYLGKIHHTADFGSYRSDICCLLYERVCDVHNFELVLRVLEPFEIAAIICRMGWLNFYNPLKPEGAIQLNLSRYEERVIAKMLCTLATTEPGNNWTQYQFRWKSEDDCVPGWELTEGWVKADGKDDGIPNRGILSLYYYSGEGKKLQGCKPNIGFRKALLYLCFLKETDIRSEEEWGQPISKEDKSSFERGAKYMINNPGIFRDYVFCDKMTALL